MSSTQTTKCTRNSWLVGLAVGLIVAYFLLNFLGLNFYLSLFLGSIVFVLGGKYLVNRFCVDSAEPDADVARPTPVPTPEVAPAPAPAAEPEAEPEPEAAPQAPATPPRPPPGDGASPSVVKPSATLPGQAELAARTGSWRYQGGAAQATAPQKAPAPAAATAVEQGASGQPEGLASPRAGGADDLKLIKGIGPKLEKLLNSKGIFHYDQIAGWAASDIAWVDDNLVGFKGRASRDAWVDQARALAAGEQTEFAKRATKDGLYD